MCFGEDDEESSVRNMELAGRPGAGVQGAAGNSSLEPRGARVGGCVLMKGRWEPKHK